MMFLAFFVTSSKIQKLNFLFLFLAQPLFGAGSEPPMKFLRGVTVSCQTWGVEWETPQMAATLDELKGLGVNAIAIHPYAQISADGSLRYTPAAKLSYVSTPLEWAKERKMHVMLIPHIAYWGSSFLWRGEIDFDSSEKWTRFFDAYEKWIVMMAGIAEEHGAELFCIGLEYGRAQKFDTRWRRIIKAIRAIYHGKITYGANWDEIEKVPFWDAVDYIGVLAYFPLTTETNPSDASIRSGWKQWMEKMTDLSRRYNRQIVFTEIGYNESAKCAAQPWAFQTGGENAIEIQSRCINQALNLPQYFPDLAGMFFWKWFPDLPANEVENFDLRTPAIKQLIGSHWKN
jgi:hypothetical protein